MKCQYCGKESLLEKPLHMHHISYYPRPLIVYLCASCHRKAHCGKLDMKLLKWLARRRIFTYSVKGVVGGSSSY